MIETELMQAYIIQVICTLRFKTGLNVKLKIRKNKFNDMDLMLEAGGWKFQWESHWNFWTQSS